MRAPAPRGKTGGMREVNFDGLIGPTHNYGGLSAGNVASMRHGGLTSHPREAALQGLAKMRFVRSLGLVQGVLPPHPRPHLAWLRRLGFHGDDPAVIRAAAAGDGVWLRMAASAAAMWTANAATVAPSCDTADGRVHLVPANLQAMAHRALEAETTHAVLRAIFRDEQRFAVHAPLPAMSLLGDEGAANHTRLHVPGRPAVHLLAWGRSAHTPAREPARFPARQTLEASQALARLLRLDPAQVLFPRQHPDGIDAGAFHTDVVAVGDAGLLLLHALAFAEPGPLLAELERRLGPGFRAAAAGADELPIADVVASYPFNSQLVTLPDGGAAIVAPIESQENPRTRAYLERLRDAGLVRAVHYLDVRQSMQNGGGPACLRLRVPLTAEERAGLGARVLLDDALDAELVAWVERHYRERLEPGDLADPQLTRETMTALDELTRVLALGPVYEFQR